VLAWADVAFRRAREAGVRVVTFGSGAGRKRPKKQPQHDADLQLTALLARMGPVAERYGVLVCVEPLRQQETNMVNRVSQAARIVGAVQHPNVAITADLYHMHQETEEAEAIRDAGALVRHVHVAEGDERTAPGRKGDDFRPYLRALRDIGYDGMISIECRWEDFAAELPRAIRTLREHGA
jgi:sugar phosphate isomerase/epimerase